MDYFNGDMLILYSNTFLYLSLFLILLKIKRYFSLGVILSLIYLIVSIVSVILFVDPYSRSFFNSLSIFPFLYLFFLFFMSSLPLMRLNEINIEAIIPVRKIIIYAFSSVVIIVFLSSIFDVVGKFNNLITNLFFDVNYANELYQDVRTYSDNDGINVLGVLNPALRDFPQFLLAYILTFKKKNKTIIVGLILSILLSVISGLANGLRGNVIFVIMSSIFCFFIFKKFYSKQLIKRVKYSALIFSFLAMIPFVLISKSRFDSGYSITQDSNYATKSYIGQSFLYFNNYAFDNNGIRNGDRTLNLFKSIFWDDVPKDFIIRRNKYQHLKISDEVFSTYIGDFVFDFGPIIAFLLVITFSVVILFKTNSFKIITLEKILILYFLWNTITFGIFLFPYADISGNIRLIIFILLYYIIRIDRRLLNSRHIGLHLKKLEKK